MEILGWVIPNEFAVLKEFRGKRKRHLVFFRTAIRFQGFTHTSGYCDDKCCLSRRCRGSDLCSRLMKLDPEWFKKNEVSDIIPISYEEQRRYYVEYRHILG